MKRLIGYSLFCMAAGIFIGLIVADIFWCILLSLLFFTSLADRLTGFLSKKFPVASEWVIAVFNGSLLILTTALLV